MTLHTVRAWRLWVQALGEKRSLRRHWCSEVSREEPHVSEKAPASDRCVRGCGATTHKLCDLCPSSFHVELSIFPM